MRIKVNMKYVGILVHWLTKCLHKTLRIQVHYHPHYQIDEPYLFAFWHGKQFLPIFELTKHKTKQVVLVSPSRDGEMLATWLQKLGYEVIRGSSRQNNISALSSMFKKLKQGYSMGFAIDGPIGPIYKVKPGTTHMAQRSGVKIIPVGSSYQKKWIIQKAWDKYEIPKPFSKGTIYLGKPLFISFEQNLEAMNFLLEKAIDEAESIAKNL